MAGCSISALSTQYVQVPVRAFQQGQPYNPTADVVEMAFVAGWTEPVTWYPASWAWTIASNGYYAIQCLVGPAGAANLAQGTYSVWVHVADNPEVPVASTGTLTITP